MGPTMKNVEALLSCGLNPKDGKPFRIAKKDINLKKDIKRYLRVIDEQDACMRYTWYNLPADLTSAELERLLYYKGQLCFFYDATLNKFFFMPYALDGTIDYYGRFNTIKPVPISSGADGENKKLNNYISKLQLNVVYGVVEPNDLTEEDLYKNTVLLHDYTKQLNQTIIPRQNLNEALLDAMADCVPFMRTSLLASTGVKGVRVQDADQQASVIDGSRSIEAAAENGDIWVPIVGPVDFQELTDHSTSKAEEYMLAMQSLDNLRLSGYGLDNGGLFEKKAHELQSEADINGGPVGLVMQDGLQIRQNFCNIVNSIWGIGIWCEPNQNVSGADIDQDGLLYSDDLNAAQTGQESEMEGIEDVTEL